MEVQSRLSSLEAAKRTHFPKVVSSFDIGKKYYQKGVKDTYDFSAKLHLTFPLFQGFYLANQIKEEKAKLEEARANLQQVELRILREVTVSRDALVHAREQVDYAQAYLESAQQDYQVQLHKYEFGTGTIVDLIHAVTAVSNARAQLAHAENKWYNSIANLTYATGMLISEKAIDFLENTQEES